MRNSEATRSDWMQTFTGRAFYPMSPRAEDVDPVDVAHALALICRYGGHVRRFYSVAEHCVLMSHAVAPENALWALLHDATEAYVGDMIRPLKRSMPTYVAVENQLMTVICDRFGIGYDCPAEVKSADNRILHDERSALMTVPPQPWVSLEDVAPLGVQIQGWTSAYAEDRYLSRLRELTDGALRCRVVTAVDWAAYRACPVCPAKAGEPCLSLTGTVAGKQVVAFEAPAPHGGRKPRAGAA